ncbi:MAG: acyl-CoA mutase large subunit family protein, partial [Alphaproteobacteria bacterium]|nr:acyl-CoA mutase large subunit family protein [Alphaproteobacteria bacterium]
ELGFPGQVPMTRGIYPTMHRGRTWSQRQLIGFGTPDDYNQRFRKILDAGANASNLAPCNSFFRGFDCDEVDPALLGTCGTVVNTVADMEACYQGVDIGAISMGMNDPEPFTLTAMLLAMAKRQGVPWSRITGTSNQSDYLSHFIANHMFLRLSLPGARRLLLDHIEFCRGEVPGWNPVSVIGQHMQQGGANPAEAMGLTLSTAIQYAADCVERGMDPNRFLPRFTFFFDISISFFEELAKFRAGRRIWQRIVRERFGATEPKAWRFKFHAQTSGVDLTQQQPLNNVARATVQAMAGIFGGLQSLHTDSYDEALNAPTEAAARVAVATQNILCEEAHLTDVIDPLGGSFYVESLTDEMEARIEEVIARIDAAGGMYLAAEAGLPQTIMGQSAIAHQDRIENGEETVVGVNKYCLEGAAEPVTAERPQAEAMAAYIADFQRFKDDRDGAAVDRALDDLARAAAAAPGTAGRNTFAKAVAAAEAGVTHGEICACLRRELGVGQPLVVA